MAKDKSGKRVTRRNLSRGLTNMSHSDNKLLRAYRASVNTDEDRDFLKTHQDNPYLNAPEITAHIESNETVRIIRETSRINDDGSLMPPAIVMAPIGPITVEHIIEGTKTFQQTSMAHDLYHSNNPSMTLRARSSLFKFVIAAFRGKNMTELTDYDLGIATVLQLMTETKWDERFLSFYLSLNHFASHADDDRTYEQHISYLKRERHEEFSTLDGSSTVHTDFLTTSWESLEHSVLRPRESLKPIVEVLNTVPRKVLVERLKHNVFNVTDIQVNKSNQSILVHRAIHDGNAEAFSAQHIKETLVPLLVSRAMELDTLTLKAVDSITSVVRGFARDVIKGDMSMTNMSNFLVNNIHQLSLRQSLCLLHAGSHTSTIIEGGSIMRVRLTLLKLVQRAQDPLDAVEFITQTIMSYDGPLPTLKQWEIILSSEELDNLLSMSPMLTFAVHDVSDKQRDNSRYSPLSLFRDRIEEMSVRHSGK